MVRATGFSQKTGTPARTAARIRPGWASVAAAITTPSTPADSTASGESTTSPPNRSAAVLAASANGSVSTSDSTASSPERVSAWKAPIRPRPRIPMRMERLPSFR
ncbi:hypothetical protein SGLAM104S_03073 [Streptomyces glaucescens]